MVQKIVLSLEIPDYINLQIKREGAIRWQCREHSKIYCILDILRRKKKAN